MLLPQETSNIKDRTLLRNIIYIASDHAGFELKNYLIEFLSSKGYDIKDMGAHKFSKEDDYPDFITPCAKIVANENMRGGEAAAHVFGIIIGGSGQGEAMAANRISGARAAVFYGAARSTTVVDEKGTAPTDSFDIIRLARQHNNANILSLGARFISEELAREAVILFLETSFSGESRHIRRISKY